MNIWEPESIKYEGESDYFLFQKLGKNIKNHPSKVQKLITSSKRRSYCTIKISSTGSLVESYVDENGVFNFTCPKGTEPILKYDEVPEKKVNIYLCTTLYII